MPRRLPTAGVLAVLLLAPTALLRADDAEGRALKTIEDLGGQALHEDMDPSKPVVVVVLSGTEPTAAQLRSLAGLKQLRALSLKDLQIKDGDLKALAALQVLKELDLAGTEVTDAGMETLAGLKGLEALNLDGTEVADAGLKTLAAMDGLQKLSLRGCPGVTDAGLKDLAKLKSLKAVFLADSGATAGGVADLMGALPGCQVSY